MNNDKARIKELTTLLNHYRDAYYNGSNPEISDYEYDNFYDELKQLEDKTGESFKDSPTRTVGYEVKSKLEKVTHNHPMLSLDKTKSTKDLIDFAGDKDCLLSLKMDGLTVLLTYENGELIQAETRGNGEVGELITHNAKVFENIPLKIDYPGHLEVEGEAIITYEDFEKINSAIPNEEDKYKNPRNLASGSVRQFDSRIAANRHIKFVCWKVPKIEDRIDGNNYFLTRLKYAEKLGFDIVPLWAYTNKSSDKDNIDKLIDDLKEKALDKGYPIDGLVMTFNDIFYGESLGMTGHHPRHSIAFKFYDEEVSSILKRIDWTMGKTGCLTPTAIFDSVEIEGTSVERASLHNVSILKELKLGIGDEVTVYKANAIIPQIRENLTKSNTVTIPDKCPICGCKTEIVKDNDTEVLYCTNENCDGKLLGKLTHAVSKNALNVDGMSESTIEKFIQLGWLTSIYDIYYLRDHADQMMKLEGFGKASVNKLMIAIDNSTHTTLDRFVYALSIKLIGRTASRDLAKSCEYDVQVFVNRMNAGYYKNMELDGFGEKMSNSLNNWWEENKNAFEILSKLFVFEKPKGIVVTDDVKKLSGKTFVITGSLEHFTNREEAKERIELLGGKVSGSVSAKTYYLVNNDVNSTSGKNKKAKELGVPIISEMQLLQMIE